MEVGGENQPDSVYYVVLVGKKAIERLMQPGRSPGRMRGGTDAPSAGAGHPRGCAGVERA